VRRLLLALTAACAATAAAAAASSYVIVGDRAVGGVRIGHGTVADARSAFGAPSSLRAQSAQICVARWSSIGLTMRFLDFSGTPCRSGGLVTVVVTSRNAFRTTLGLRVGDSTARLKRLFPHARSRTDPHPPWTGYWLIPRRTCNEVGRLPYPGLLARVRAGNVTTIVVQTTACE
jgi:hypothetical protein